MRAVIQRVSKGQVKVEGEVIGAIGQGFVVLLGIGKDDSSADVQYLAEKVVNLRVFEDPEGKMNLSLLDVGGEVLAVSQFTLFGDCRKGRRPSFFSAAPPETAQKLYQEFVSQVSGYGVSVATGRFQAMMEVELVNDGPVTLLVDSKREF